MKAHELMIGNWVEIIQPKKGIYTTIQPSSFSVNIEKTYKPIPITEQWLIDFGFKEDDREELIYEVDGFSIRQTRFMDLWLIGGSLSGDYPLNEECIKYVHQLQNLFFCLTGKQLNKKPKR